MTNSIAPVPADVVVIGGSYAGMSAALQLARACRSVVIIDHEQPRNRTASRAHGCLGWDGCAPGDLLRTARQQLEAYGSVRWITDEAAGAQGSAGRGFQVICASGRLVSAHRLILAHGVIDQLPAIPGLKARWGQGVLHCPYCHGYELCGGSLGLLVAPGDDALAHAKALQQWGHVTVFHRGDQASQALDALHAGLSGIGATLERSPLLSVSGHATADLADGRRTVLRALFLHPETALGSPIAHQLGCRTEAAGCISTDAAKQTTVEGVFACGDAARFAGNIALAIGEGALAGVAAHRSLLGLLE
ncbi:thioredoxin reductase [Stenotrophomonas sp. ZAC14D2_NAIMI4_7]|uniref:NAD(P)/FAD-dependent oxidoreductase n=1 Tax=Stenotrophomonas sp. ZAC14D2_NAIMI4_7 TaxID=2072405 RepID=UPI000D5409FB|nr:NAD(P)/FAD-dependent oxidoreductase [Stenotrophomonas sp. ZAC14D2_NAIMI4_7]AWH17649.1 thioredoxin reductase [Stenotrophomonas sp. ZAC14D2_NAIMI4_7]